MNEINILVFEDDIESNKGAFEFSNALSFEGRLNIRFAPQSQDVDMGQLSDYDVIFVDITLAAKTQMDGYSILNNILQQSLVEAYKVRVMTGNSRVEEMMKNHGIPDGTFKVFHKPVDYKIISKNIQDIMNETDTRNQHNIEQL